MHNLQARKKAKQTEVTRPRLLRVAVMVTHVSNLHFKDWSALTMFIFWHWQFRHNSSSSVVCPGKTLSLCSESNWRPTRGLNLPMDTTLAAAVEIASPSASTAWDTGKKIKCLLFVAILQAVGAEDVHTSFPCVTFSKKLKRTAAYF